MKSKTPKTTAYDIKQILKIKHKEDVFVDECKIGSAWMQANCQILDAWVMNKSWSNACVTGYEIKVSRGDFVQDNKWRGYLPYCNELYFVCPKDLIKPDEVTDGVGLRYVVGKSRILTKVKARYRELEIPESIYRYILMSRVRVTRNSRYREGSREYWENWLKEKEVDKRFGWGASRAIRKAVEDKINKVATINRSLRLENEKLTGIKEILKKLGFDSYYLDRWNFEDKFKEKIKEIESGVPDGLVNYIKSARQMLAKMQDVLER